MHAKSNSVFIFLLFSKHVENLFNTKNKIFQTNNGMKYRKFSHILHANGTHHCFTCPYTSAQNGLVERKHRQLIETGLTLLSMASVPLSYWYDAFFTSCYLMNIVPLVPTGYKSPYELLFHRTPDYTSL